ncbi:MAG TPA: SCO family protein [Thermoanaerobaculia bacterium]|nr:SCO family protein [Thermoanaerobaculia bacterium]
MRFARFRALALGLGVIASASGCRNEVPLPSLFAVPASVLTSDRGTSVDLSQFHERVVVYDFIFTSCVGTCPLMTRSMATLANEVASDDVRFVSISVDPERDTPEVLHAYAQRAGKDERWIFLTGEREAIHRLSVEGFKLAAGDPGEMPGAEAVLHSNRFALADRRGMIRGYYDGTSAEEMETLVRDIRTLVRER